MKLFLNFIIVGVFILKYMIYHNNITNNNDNNNHTEAAPFNCSLRIYSGSNLKILQNFEFDISLNSY